MKGMDDELRRWIPCRHLRLRLCRAGYLPLTSLAVTIAPASTLPFASLIALLSQSLSPFGRLGGRGSKNAKV